MNELRFLAMNIPEEVKDSVYHKLNSSHKELSESDTYYYCCGVEDTLLVLKDVLQQDKEHIVINDTSYEIPEEISVDELDLFFCED